MIVRKMKRWIALAWMAAILLQGYAFNVTALDVEVTEAVSEISDIAAVSETTPTYGVAGIEDGEIYALQNVGSGLWASTSVNTGTYFYIHNTFQHSVWNNAAQTFRFVKTGSGDNTYLIYPLEYNEYNANGARALYCNYNIISSNQPDTVNVTYAPYSDAKANCCEWIVEQRDGYVHSIRLKADPKYVLCAIGDTAGNENSSTTGNIVVKKLATETTVPNNYQKWNITYVLQEEEFYFKNRGSGLFMYGQDDVLTRAMDGSITQKWELDHYQNGMYQIYRADESMLVYLVGTADGGDVTLSGNNMQPSSMWYFERLAGGSFKIVNAGTKSSGRNYALQPQSVGVSSVKNKTYVADTNRIDEWYVMPTSGIYGFQTFLELDEALYGSVNCHGYAMHMAEWPNDWLESTYDYYYNYSLDYIDDWQDGQSCEQYKSGFHNAVKWDFEYWLSFIDDICFVLEEDFADNGQSAVLSYNQYRVVMKTGYHVVPATYNGEDILVAVFDYHFWYQTYDGSWANKHGQGIPERIEKGMTPFSENSQGWVLEAISWPIAENVMIDMYLGEDYYFYDSEVSTYIITVY